MVSGEKFSSTINGCKTASCACVYQDIAIVDEVLNACIVGANPTVTKRIKEYTFLEKNLRTEEEAENRSLWGRVVKSATWAKRLFVKKRDVASTPGRQRGMKRIKGA